ncbi:MAG: PilZ domain-containing protein [Planctomycetes bacterium]|nr:PilZ domain-containing protein [Planctomycetota bacterium]
MDELKATGIQGRQSPRVDLDGDVRIEFDGGAIAGSGQNISVQGVFFTADASVPVTVHVAGRGQVRGQLVRLESMGDGRFGIAVRFDEAVPAMVPSAS